MVNETGSNVDILLEDGDQAQCTFTNVQSGMLKIVKKSIDGDGIFSFESDVPALGNFDLTTVEGMNMTDIVNVTGIFNVTEIVPNGWFLK